MATEFTPAQLSDIQSCYNLVVDCASIIDESRYDDLALIFSEDGIFARPTVPDEPISGRATIIAAFKKRPANKLGQHLVLNIRVKLTGADTAEGTSSIMLFMADAEVPFENGKGRKAVGPVLGTYRDRYVRTAEGWRIADRRGRVTFYGG
ncbi:MAG: nuclear transport factor 2 family protein [Steroidobacteraceae bacterium]